MSNIQDEKFYKPKPVDLVKAFYEENVDLENILKSRKSTRKVLTGLEPYSGEFSEKQKKHLLNRTLIGHARRHLIDLDGLNLNESINLIFTPEPKPEDPINDYYHEVDPSFFEGENNFDVDPGISWVNAPEHAPWQRSLSYYAWVRKHMINQNTSIHWKLFLFLHNLLPTTQEGTGCKGRYENFTLLFNSCFRDYKETILDVTLDANMMLYLNLDFSRKEYPDENYARELQELFTVGKGPNSKFTEDDVVAISEILVGWHTDFENWHKNGKLGYKFDSNNHITTDKVLSDFYDNAVIKGREGQDGKLELFELLDVLFKNQETALYLSRRLYQFFVYPVIDQTTEELIIEPLSKIIRDSNYRLDQALKVLLTSEHFFDIENQNCIIKSPLEFSFGIIKEFDFEIINGESNEIPSKYTDPLTKDYYFYSSIDNDLYRQGFDIGNPPSVSGWPAYYQTPVYDMFWINSDTISKRASFGYKLAQEFLFLGHSENGNILAKMNLIEFVKGLNNPSDLNEVINESISILLNVEISQDQKDEIKYDVLGSNSLNDQYYSDLYNNYISNPNENIIFDLDRRLKVLFSRIFQLGEIHIF